MIMTEKKKLIIKWIAGITGSIIFIWFGYDTQSLEVKNCSVKSTKYVKAEYSETDCGYDFDGNYVCDTDYWDKPASPVWTVYTFNGVISDTGTPHTNQNGIGIVDMPPHDRSHKKRMDFDNFSYHKKNILTTAFTDGTTATDGINLNNKCIESIGNDTTVKTWYTIRYSIGE